METLYWLLDLDDTLASSALTWSLKSAFPKLIRENNLKIDKAVFSMAVLMAQKRSNEEADPEVILAELFEALHWPAALQAVLLEDIQASYTPELFDDTLAFLQALQEARQPAWVISNNPRAPRVVQALGIDRYITQTLTPHICPDTSPKPHRSLWDYLVAQYPQIDQTNALMVGDDPWSDGLFAEECGMRCVLVDRYRRFSTIDVPGECQIVAALAELVPG